VRHVPQVRARSHPSDEQWDPTGSTEDGAVPLKAVSNDELFEFESFDILRVLERGKELLSSSGKEFEDVRCF
jgi:hypothetical protein